jgi:hypothetical protein
LNHKFMIMSRITKQPALLHSCFQQIGIQSATLYGQQETYSDSPVLLGTIPKMGTGFDEENFCSDFKGTPSDVLILTTSISEDNLPLYIQVSGRAMRSENPIIVYLVDEHNICKRHFKATEEWIRKTNGTIIEAYWTPNGILLPPIVAKPTPTTLSVE